MLKLNTMEISKLFFKQFDPTSKFANCELFTQMKEDFAKLLDTHTFENMNATLSKELCDNFFNNYKNIDKFINCHLKDEMSIEMNNMFNNFESYISDLTSKKTTMKIKFDGKEFYVKEGANNIVEVAQDNGVHIPAPCFRNNKSKGCCNGCLILVNGERGFACNQKPADGMEITYNREDLEEERRANMKKYADNIKLGNLGGNSCSKETSSESSGCGCSCSCSK